MTTIAELAVSIRSRGAKEAARDLDVFQRSAGKADTAAAALATTAKRAVGVLAATGLIYTGTRAILDNARAYENASSRLRLYLQDAKVLARTQLQLFEVSQRAGTSLEGTTELYTKLAGASEELRNDQTKLLRVVELFSKGLVVSGADAAAAASSTRQFAQALASGTLRGDEFVSVMEGAPRVAKALADGLGVPIGKLRDLASQGKLTADTVTAALLRGGEAIDAEFTKMPLTVDRATQRVKNSFLQLIGQTDETAGASRELAKAIDSVGRAMGDPQTIAAFQATAAGLLKVASAAFSAVGALREYYATDSQKSLNSLLNKRVAIENELFSIGRKTGVGYRWREQALRAELATTEKLISAKEREARAGNWVQGRVTRKSGQGRWANVNSDPNAAMPAATLDVGTGDVSRADAKAAAFRAIGSGAREAADALRDFTFEEQQLTNASLAMEQAKSQALVAFERIRAEMAGPLAVAEFEHIQAMQEIARLGAEAGVGADAIEQAQARQREAYEQTTAAILEQQRVAANPKAIAFMDDFRRGAADAFFDVASGAASAKNALKDFFDSLAQQLLRASANSLISNLFGAPGTSGAGSAGGGWLWSLASALFGGAKGFARGGYTGNGDPSDPAGIVHRGEYVIPAALVSRMGGPSGVERRMHGGNGAGFVQNVSFTIEGRVDRETQSQIAARAGGATQRALMRNR